jgi:hypothetical protein
MVPDAKRKYKFCGTDNDVAACRCAVVWVKTTRWFYLFPSDLVKRHILHQLCEWPNGTWV